MAKAKKVADNKHVVVSNTADGTPVQRTIRTITTEKKLKKPANVKYSAFHCMALTTKGVQCRNNQTHGIFCHVHDAMKEVKTVKDKEKSEPPTPEPKNTNPQPEVEPMELAGASQTGLTQDINDLSTY